MSVSVCAGKRHPRPRQRSQTRSLQVRAHTLGIIMNPTGVKGHSVQTTDGPRTKSCEDRDDEGEEMEFIVFLMSFQWVD